MAEDYYKVLGVSRDASQADISRSYRGLARKLHPDLNPDDDKAKEKFQKVQAAFDVLHDPSKRELYDRYGSSFESMGGGGGRSSGGGFHPGAGGASFEDVDLSQFFGERYGGRGGGSGGGFADFFSQFRNVGGGDPRNQGPGVPSRGADLASKVSIPFVTSVNGGEVQLSIRRASGKSETISVKIPPGIEDGKKIRLRGQGEAPPPGGTPGDLLITVQVEPHEAFERRGNQLYLSLPVTLAEAVLGAKVDVPTPRGTVSLRIAPGTSSGTKLRIKGHGVTTGKGAAGDLFAVVQIVLPEKLSDEDRAAVEAMAARNPFNPRTELRW
jgi:DnaJ-class molecular chaperone